MPCTQASTRAHSEKTPRKSRKQSRPRAPGAPASARKASPKAAGAPKTVYKSIRRSQTAVAHLQRSQSQGIAKTGAQTLQEEFTEVEEDWDCASVLSSDEVYGVEVDGSANVEVNRLVAEGVMTSSPATRSCDRGQSCHWKKGFWKRSASPGKGRLRFSPRQLPIASDLFERLRRLEDLDRYIVLHPRYKRAVAEVVDAMLEVKLTLNHVNCFRALEELSDYGCLRPPVFQCMNGYAISDLDKGDIMGGIGYYHFSRVSVGSMKNSPQFALTGMTSLAENSIMFFIDPRVFSSHHFCAGEGNPTKGNTRRCAGKLDSLMTKEDALEEALRAVSKLNGLIQQGVTNVPLGNEVAVFKGVESRFVYPCVAVLEGCKMPHRTEFIENRIIEVKPTTKRYDVGKKAIARS